MNDFVQIHIIEIRSNRISQKNQQGMALLTILLLVVAITIVAGSMLASQKIMQRQYALTSNQDQMREYALAGEAWASQLIVDSQANPQASQSDSLQDSWAKPLPPLLMDNATIEVKINDEASKFNLNNLYHDGKVDEQAMAVFRKLLVSQNINPAIANAVLDWQDPDSDPHPEGGAEFDFYQSTGKAMPMPIANQPFISVDELAWVRGVQKADFDKLQPLVTAVPYFLPINVNTAKPELLVALFSTPDSLNTPTNLPATTPPSSPLSSGATTQNPITATATAQIPAVQIAGWANSRATAIALNSINEFWALPMFAASGIDKSASQKQNLQNLLAVKSGAFMAMVKVSDEGRTLYLTSILAKQTNSLNGISQNKNLPNPNPLNQNSQNQLPQNNSGQSVMAFNRRILPFLSTD